MNYILTANGELRPYNDELYHYGVPGMKWGKRKASYETERSAYKQAKKDYRSARRELNQRSYFAVGRKGLKSYNAAEKKANKAELDMIDAKAKYKAAKAKNAEKAEKAAAKVYRKEMSKTGLVGSAADRSSGGRSERLYNHMKATKGKAYADAIEKKVANRAYASIAASAAVVVGSQVALAMMNREL